MPNWKAPPSLSEDVYDSQGCRGPCLRSEDFEGHFLTLRHDGLLRNKGDLGLRAGTVYFKEDYHSAAELVTKAQGMYKRLLETLPQEEAGMEGDRWPDPWIHVPPNECSSLPRAKKNLSDAKEVHWANLVHSIAKDCMHGGSKLT